MHIDARRGAAVQKIIVALDYSTSDEARKLVSILHGEVGIFKIGLELILSDGLPFARQLVESGASVFLDAKLLDIPHTVERAVANAAMLGAHFLTIHGSDGKTLDAAVRGRGQNDLKLLAVTVLTSLSADDLSQQGIDGISPEALVLRRARMAQQAGFDGVVASAREAAMLRAELGSDFLIVTPGIRPAGSAVNDQTRIVTPGEAIAAGANYLVIGRPITAATDPRAVVDAIIAEIEAALPA